MRYRSRTVMVLTLAGACALTIAATAVARTTHSGLRIEGPGKTLDGGNNYSNGTIRTRNSNACGQRDSRRERLRGPTALGLIGHAAKVNRRLNPFRTSDTFGFGAILCRVGEFSGFGGSFWLYKVNHADPGVGGDQLKVGRRDDVLWYFVRSDGRNSGDELALQGVPPRVRPGARFEVQAVAYDSQGNATVAPGVRIRNATAPTGPDGRTTVEARSTSGSMSVRGRRGDDIPSESLLICVDRNLSRCPAVRGERFFGSPRADKILATAGPDVIRARRGRDLVRSRRGDDLVGVRGGGRDVVNCGKGRDVVNADARDRIKGNCEVVRRGG